MARLLKCYGYCNQKYPKEELRKLKINKNASGDGQNFCKDCYDRKVKEVADREALYNFIQSTYNLTFPTGLILRQIKNFHEERGYTYKNIRFTLDYVFNIKKSYKPIVQYGISMVPYFHDEMIEYYRELKKKRENLVLTNGGTEVYQISPLQSNSDYLKNKLINMEELMN